MDEQLKYYQQKPQLSDADKITAYSCLKTLIHLAVAGMLLNSVFRKFDNYFDTNHKAVNKMLTWAQTPSQSRYIAEFLSLISSKRYFMDNLDQSRLIQPLFNLILSELKTSDSSEFYDLATNFLYLAPVTSSKLSSFKQLWFN